MTKRTRTVRRLQKTASDGEPKDLTTFSLRLNDEDRDRVARAAALRGWSPTSFIRMACLERAGEISNTSAHATFKGLAMRVAEQLARPRTYIVKFGLADGSGDTWEDRKSEQQLADVREKNNPDVEVLGVIPVIEQLSKEDLAEVSKAAQHGGAEFLRLIIEYSEALAAHDRLDTTKLIDPKPTGL